MSTTCLTLISTCDNIHLPDNGCPPLNAPARTSPNAASQGVGGGWKVNEMRRYTVGKHAWRQPCYGTHSKLIPSIYSGRTRDKGVGITWFRDRGWLLIWIIGRFVILEYNQGG